MPEKNGAIYYGKVANNMKEGFGRIVFGKKDLKLNYTGFFKSNITKMKNVYILLFFNFKIIIAIILEF